MDWAAWEAIAAALVAVGGATAVGVKIGAARARANGESAPPTCSALQAMVEKEAAETRSLILAVKEGDRALVKELRDGFIAEMRELRGIEARQNELIAAAVGEMRMATEAMRQAASRVRHAS